MRARARVCTQSPRPHHRFSAHHNPLTTLRPVQWGTHEVCGCDPLCHHLVNVQPWHAHMQDANQSRDRCAALMHMLMPSSVRSLAASMRDKVLCTINTDVGGLWHRRRVSNALHACRTACAVSIQLAYSLADSLPLSLLFDAPRHTFALNAHAHTLDYDIHILVTLKASPHSHPHVLCLPQLLTLMGLKTTTRLGIRWEAVQYSGVLARYAVVTTHLPPTDCTSFLCTHAWTPSGLDVYVMCTHTKNVSCCVDARPRHAHHRRAHRTCRHAPRHTPSTQTCTQDTFRHLKHIMLRRRAASTHARTIDEHARRVDVHPRHKHTRRMPCVS